MLTLLLAATLLDAPAPIHISPVAPLLRLPRQPPQAPVLQAPPPPGTYPYQNSSLPVEQRIDNLLTVMTMDEKIACLNGGFGVPRLGIRGTNFTEGIHGLSMGGPRMNNRGPGIPTTTFPQGIGLGETWDPALIQQAASAEGNEARYIYNTRTSRFGSLIVLSPNADLGRDPRWGRTEECYGEDPFFNGTMVTAFVKGLQGESSRHWQSASLLKHFLANSNEDGRDHTSSDFDERLWREYYSVPFRMGIVLGGARAYMAAYNKVNGIPAAVHPMLRDITVREWGNDGVICSDGGAITQLVTTHKYFPDPEHAVAGALHAGLTRFLDNTRAATRTAFDHGLISEADIDDAVRRDFRLVFKLGLMDPPELAPYSSVGGDAPWLSDDNKALVRQVTRESIVLLKNAGTLLPIDRTKLKSIAVIGPCANEVRLDWYSGLPPYKVTPLDGIKAALAPNVQVTYSDGKDPAEAARVAKAADVALVMVGNNPISGQEIGWGKIDLPSEGREAVDRKSIDLEQEALVKAVSEANPRTVAVLVSSFPYAINWTQEHVPAIVHLAHGSQEEGNALADVLFGDYNPAGRLVQTWPSSLDQLPPMMDYDILHGRTYMYFKGHPLYPFGFGLSYTAFAYSNLRVSGPALAPYGAIGVLLDVKNTGRRAGDEVIQLYARHLGSKVARPNLELKGFFRVHLEPGEKRTVSLPLTWSSLAYWDTANHRWVVEGDRIELEMGRSSTDIKMRKTIEVRPSNGLPVDPDRPGGDRAL